MKKISALFLALCCTNINIQTELKLESFKPKSDIPELSFDQDIQLDYLSSELNAHSKIIADQWTNDENTRVLIERTELAVQESSKDTQGFMKKRIIQLFKDYEIDIFFTKDNVIELAHKTSSHQKSSHGIHIAHDKHEIDDSDFVHTPHYHFHSLSGHNDQDDTAKEIPDEMHFDEIHFKEFAPKHPHKKKETATTTTVVLPTKAKRIHGGRRTLNKIKRRWAEQERKEKELQAKKEKRLPQDKPKETTESKSFSIKPGIEPKSPITHIKLRIEPWRQHLQQEQAQQHIIESREKLVTHEAPEPIVFHGK